MRPSENKASTPSITFVKAGSKPKKMKTATSGLLHQTSDWKLIWDFNSQLIFPAFIALTQLRPDLVIFSTSRQTVIIIELTCPCEENMESWHHKKVEKYNQLCNAVKQNGWKVHFFAVEIGACGYCAESLRICFRQLGFNNKHTKAAVKELSSVAMQCSFSIWLSRGNAVWDSTLLKPNTSDHILP